MGLDFNFAFQRAMQELEYLKDDLTLDQRKKKAYEIATQEEERGQLKQSLSDVLKTIQPINARSAGTPQYTSQPITQLQMGTETEPFSNKSLYTNVPQNYPNQRILQTLTGQGQPYQEPLPPQAGTPQANTQMYAQGLGAGLPEGIAQNLMQLQQPKEVKTEQIDIPGEGGMRRVLADEAGNIVQDFGLIPAKKTKSEEYIETAAQEAQQQLTTGAITPIEKDLTKTAEMGTGPWATMAAAFDAVAGGLGVDAVFGLEGFFPKTQNARQMLRTVRQIGKAALMISSRGAVWEQEKINELFPDPDKLWRNPETEARKFNQVRQTIIDVKRENLKVLASGSATAIEVRKLRESNTEIDRLMALIGTGQTGQATSDSLGIR